MVRIMAPNHMRLLWALSPAAAQDVFLAAKNGGVDVEVGNNQQLGSYQPTKGDQIGCGDSCDPGDDFDHWNDRALDGAISKICFKLGSVKAIHSLDWITGGQFCYGGNCVSQGTGADDCFQLTSGEVIAELKATSGCTPRGADHWGVSSITIKLNTGRTRKWGGRECSSEFTITPPSGTHISSFYGRASGGHIGWGGLFSKIGVYYGVGAGRGRWHQIGGGAGFEPPTVVIKSCTTASSSTTVSTTSEWSRSSYSEFNEGFTFEGISDGEKKSITKTYSHSVTDTTSSSFESTVCEEVTQTCKAGLSYAFQFEFLSNFDGRGTATTKTSHWVCSDKAEVCCLPLYFNDDQDATQGCKTGSPNLCA